jgi:hypothetical protein
MEAYREANPAPANPNQKYLVADGRQLTDAQIQRESARAELSALTVGPLSAIAFGLTGDVNVAGMVGGLEQMAGAMAAPRSATRRSRAPKASENRSARTEASVSAKKALSTLWELHPFKRGRRAEQALGAQKDMRANRPAIDKAAGNSITSIKSVDINAPSIASGNSLYVNVMRYAKSLSNFGKYGVNTYKQATRALVQGNPNRVLELAIPWTTPSPAQQRQMNNAVKAAAELGVTIRFRRIE